MSIQELAEHLDGESGRPAAQPAIAAAFSNPAELCAYAIRHGISLSTTEAEEMLRVLSAVRTHGPVALSDSELDGVDGAGAFANWLRDRLKPNPGASLPSYWITFGTY